MSVTKFGSVFYLFENVGQGDVNLPFPRTEIGLKRADDWVADVSSR